MEQIKNGVNEIENIAKNNHKEWLETLTKVKIVNGIPTINNVSLGNNCIRYEIHPFYLDEEFVPMNGSKRINLIIEIQAILEA